jgi:hypothetical protein
VLATLTAVGKARDGPPIDTLGIGWVRPAAGYAERLTLLRMWCIRIGLKNSSQLTNPGKSRRYTHRLGAQDTDRGGNEGDPEEQKTSGAHLYFRLRGEMTTDGYLVRVPYFIVVQSAKLSGKLYLSICQRCMTDKLPGKT